MTDDVDLLVEKAVEDLLLLVNIDDAVDSELYDKMYDVVRRVVILAQINVLKE